MANIAYQCNLGSQERIHFDYISDGSRHIEHSRAEIISIALHKRLRLTIFFHHSDRFESEIQLRAIRSAMSICDQAVDSQP